MKEKERIRGENQEGIHLIYSAHIMFNDIAHCCSMFVNTNTENRWQWQYRFLSRLSFLYSLLGVSIFLLYIAALLARLKIYGESKNKRKKYKSDLRFLNQNQFWCTIKIKPKFKKKKKKMGIKFLLNFECELCSRLCCCYIMKRPGWPVLHYKEFLVPVELKWEPKHFKVGSAIVVIVYSLPSAPN